MSETTGPRVLVLYEDKTSGGLHSFVKEAVTKGRKNLGKPRFSYFEAISAKGNSKLVGQCASYDLLRFHGPHRADHVVAVIDALHAERALEFATPHWSDATRHDEEYALQCRYFDDQIRTRLRNKAFKKLTSQQREEERLRFHPIALFWEQESFFLAAGDLESIRLRLTIPPELSEKAAILRTRHPADLIDSLWKEKQGKSLIYKKSTDGPKLFEFIKKDPARWDSILDRVPTLNEIIETLVNL